ncbi:hypothetical protein L226DRAFT_617795 [Lentinus tigrinus ALCF2SS1-7]|uniref:C3H1-type domain-containing protein n=1 Tax=Lentinus tigrinus ALCF2SS1-6 TaxID=1328759 RepID=A0A5C2RLM5_9APHY|nr:hypothetical protein L227DRAFT_658763 [Lentinus tigrinus ALCF2SS1-6]RPD67968.1 hypothetical protein L226DRAFT_617795 [Lentinus tigrinus ALCF2SS1-7]
MPSKPLVVILCPEQFDLFLSVYAEQLDALEEKLEIRTANTPEQVRRYLNSTVRPQAFIVADAFITTPSYRDVLIRLVDYARIGGTVIYAGLLSSLSTPSSLSDNFEHAWKLPWRTGPYHRETVDFNAVRGINTNHVSKKYSMKALFLANVERQHAVYLEPADIRRVEAGPHGRDVYETPAAFAPVGRGFLGYIGDVNGEPGTTKLLLAMCLRRDARPPATLGTGAPPTDISSVMNSAAAAIPSAVPLNNPRRKVLLLSLQKYDWHDEVYSQLYRALARNAYLSEVCNPADAVSALSEPSLPDAVIVSNAAITEKSQIHMNILQKLVEYTKNGGTLIFAMSFSSFLPPLKAREFFQRWGLPWDAGSYFRTTFALNPAGVPRPLSESALVPSFSMKALHLKNVSSESGVYYATPDSHIESHVFAPDEISPEEATETPAVFAPVGRGFLGYVGDVNGEQGSTRLILEMCGVHIRPGDMGPRKFSQSVSIGPSGEITPDTRIEEEVPLPAQPSQNTSTDRPPRPREAEVRARAAACEKVRKENIVKADRLKEEGNEFFKQEKWAQAAQKYREAALLAGPQPVYVSNLAAALLKLKEWDAADSAASRALLYDPNHIKSLFRRALARKERGQYLIAESDLYHLLSIDKTNEPARAELNKLQARRPNPDEEIDVSDEDALREALEIDYSDTDEHTGNFVPCKFYNHGGCRKGDTCRFMHAPDLRSVRDELERNVCLSWLVGECYHGGLCLYAHDKTYLPEHGWWTSEKRLRWAREAFDEAVALDAMDVPESILAEAIKPLPWRYDLWVHPSAGEKAKALQPASGSRSSRNIQAGSSAQTSSSRAGQGSSRANRASTHWPLGDAGISAACGVDPAQWGNNSDDDYDYENEEEEEEWEDTDDEMEERGQYFGHTRAEFEELICQGIKPWDVLPGSIPFGDL